MSSISQLRNKARNKQNQTALGQALAEAGVNSTRDVRRDINDMTDEDLQEHARAQMEAWNNDPQNPKVFARRLQHDQSSLGGEIVTGFHYENPIDNPDHPDHPHRQAQPESTSAILDLDQLRLLRKNSPESYKALVIVMGDDPLAEPEAVEVIEESTETEVLVPMPSLEPVVVEMPPKTEAIANDPAAEWHYGLSKGLYDAFDSLAKYNI